MLHRMSEDEYESIVAELAAESAWERRRQARREAHPNPRDPEYVEWDEGEKDMAKFTVVVRAVITKTYTVEAADELEATERAHEAFSVLNDGEDEDYTQDVISIEERQA